MPASDNAPCKAGLGLYVQARIPGAKRKPKLQDMFVKFLLQIPSQITFRGADARTLALRLACEVPFAHTVAEPVRYGSNCTSFGFVHLCETVLEL